MSFRSARRPRAVLLALVLLGTGFVLTATAGITTVFRDGFEGTGICSAAAWNGGATGLGSVGGPYDGSLAFRYSGKCAYRTTGIGQYVTDNSPTSETTYRARFYFNDFLGFTGTNTARVLEVLDDVGVSQVSVVYSDAGSFHVHFGTSTTPDASTAVVPNTRWYSVEVSIQQGNRCSSSSPASAARRRWS